MSRRSKYPWDLWTDGRVHDIQKGRDYECTTAAIRQALYSAAIDRNMTVKTTILRDPPGVEFKFTKVQPRGPEIKPWGPPTEENDEPYDDRSWIPDEAIAAMNQPYEGK